MRIAAPSALLVSFTFVFATSCGPANVALNAPAVLPENRIQNHSRAELFVQILPDPEEPGASETSRQAGDRGARAITPDTAPATRKLSARSPVSDSPAGPEDKDGFFVGLSLSGGGSRSANFCAAVMFQLEKVGLLQRVDYISSVSGGSLTAAYYCASGADWNPAAAQQKLTQSFATGSIIRTLMPWNQLAFLFSDYNRSDLLADEFQQTLFSRGGRALTYADLRPDRPRLLINSTDLQSGQRFIFCNESFDAINSNLSRYPLAYAVTASAAVPVLLHPITLRDYSTRFQQFKHLVDGGLRDNLGVQTLVETYAAQVAGARRRAAPDPYPHGAVFIIVDAQTDFNADLSNQSGIGLIASLKTALGLSSTLLLNRASSATLAETILNNAPGDEPVAKLREQLRRLRRDGFVQMTDGAGHPVRVLYVSLSQVNALPDLPFNTFSQNVNDIDTYFNIDRTEAYELYQAADLLIKYKFTGALREVMRELDAAPEIDASGQQSPGAKPQKKERAAHPVK